MYPMHELGYWYHQQVADRNMVPDGGSPIDMWDWVSIEKNVLPEAITNLGATPHPQAFLESASGFKPQT
jgi:hypothetical protein